jgi:hypothetical protein
MDKRQIFVEKLSEMLTRFNIQDKFGQMPTHIARFKIADFAYNVLEQIVKDEKEQNDRTNDNTNSTGSTESESTSI